MDERETRFRSRTSSFIVAPPSRETTRSLALKAPIVFEGSERRLTAGASSYEAEHLTDLPPLRRRLPDGLYVSVT